MTVQARVSSDPIIGRISVYLVDTENGLVFGPDRVIGRGEIPPGAAMPEDAAILRLNAQWFELVLAALNDFATGEKAPGDAYALRRDLDHEKGRVDKLIDFALEAARRPPMQAIDLSPRS